MRPPLTATAPGAELDMPAVNRDPPTKTVSAALLAMLGKLGPRDTSVNGIDHIVDAGREARRQAPGG